MTERDISEVEHYLKKELYSKIKNDSSLFDFLQQGSLDGLWYWDLENPENEWMSPRFWEVLGYDHKEKKHLSSEWQNIIFQEDLQVAIDNLHKHCSDSKHPYDQVVRYRHKSGSTVWVRCRGIAIRDPQGKPVRMLGAHTDITALKQAEEQLIIKTQELEKSNCQLQEALSKIKTLKGLIPICAWCKKIRDDNGFWEHFESFIRTHAEVNFSHGMCPECYHKHYGEAGSQPEDKMK